jgi:hypothetical protein
LKHHSNRIYVPIIMGLLNILVHYLFFFCCRVFFLSTRSYVIRIFCLYNHSPEYIYHFPCVMRSCIAVWRLSCYECQYFQVLFLNCSFMFLKQAARNMYLAWARLSGFGRCPVAWDTARRDRRGSQTVQTTTLQLVCPHWLQITKIHRSARWTRFLTAIHSSFRCM